MLALLALGTLGASLCWLALTLVTFEEARVAARRLARRFTWLEKQRLALLQAGLGWVRPEWWVALRVIAPFAAAMVAYGFFRIAILAVLAALAVHHLMGLLLEIRRRRAQTSRQAALLDAIRYGAAMMARAGNALQMVQGMSETGPFEARRTFRDLAAMTAGDGALSLSAAARAEQERLADPLFDDFALALVVQSEQGGRLVPALDALVDEWDEVLRLRREAKAMRAGVEASVLLLSLLPLAFLLAIQALAPTLLRPFQSVGGEVLLGLALAWMVLGYGVLQRMSAAPKDERLKMAGSA